MADLDKTKGGPVTAVIGLSAEQLRAGHGVCVAATDIGWDGIAMGVPSQLFSSRDPFWRFSTSMARSLSALVDAHDIAHLHGLWDFPILAAASACQRARKPYVVTLHGMLNSQSLSHRAWKKRTYLALAGMRILKHAARLHFTSERERNNLSFPEYLEKAFVCPFGVNAHEIALDVDGFRRRHSLSTENQVILFLGRLHPQKRPHLLVDAFETIVNDVPGARLVFAGEGEKHFVRGLMTYAAKGTRGKVIFTGALARGEVANAYAASDVFALPSLEESLGLSVLEAMAAGRPVIVTPEVGVAALIEESGAGVVAEPDALAIGRWLRALLQDGALRGRMARNGQELVKTHFTWETAVQRLDAEYRNALASPRPKIFQP